MQLVEKVLGNRSDPEWKAKLEGAALDALELTQWEAQKNRLRKDTAGGRSLAISLDRDTFLQDGDILLWDEAAKTAVVCAIDLCEVMVIDLADLLHLPVNQIVQCSVELGHALGNQHWPAVVRNGCAYVPLAINRMVMNSVMKTHRFENITWHFASGAEVAKALGPEQARRLFGGADPDPHAGHVHSHAGGHDHEHDQGHAHDHDGQGHCHGHGHDGHDGHGSCCAGRRAH